MFLVSPLDWPRGPYAVLRGSCVRPNHGRTAEPFWLRLGMVLLSAYLCLAGSGCYHGSLALLDPERQCWVPHRGSPPGAHMADCTPGVDVVQTYIGPGGTCWRGSDCDIRGWEGWHYPGQRPGDPFCEETVVLAFPWCPEAVD
jgi:hypothetical protein